MPLFIVSVLGFISFVLLLGKWRYLLHGLLLYLPFSGVLVFWSENSPIMFLAKDFLYVLPLLLAGTILNPNVITRAFIPAWLTILIVLFSLLVILQMMNPGVTNLGAALVGLKVWLLYIPLLYITAGMINTRADLIGILRALIIVAPIPCLLGIWLWYQSEVGSYRAVMISFYGFEAAKNATQDFAQFSIGGVVRRIPSTFTNAQAFFIYCLTSACAALALQSVETSGKWKLFSTLVFILAFIASFFSGMRIAFVLSPLVAIAFFILPGQKGRALSGLIGVPLLIGSFFYISDFELEGLAEGLVEHAGAYEQRDFTIRQVLFSLEQSPFGNGTGTNTMAARYVVDMTVGDNASLGFFEVYLAKASHELGFLGFVLVAAIMFGTSVVCIAGGLKISDRQLRSAHAALGAGLLALVAHCFKAPTLDLDPGNVIFWIFLGMMLKLKHLAPPPLPAARLQRGRLPVRAVVEMRSYSAGQAN